MNYKCPLFSEHSIEIIEIVGLISPLSINTKIQTYIISVKKPFRNNSIVDQIWNGEMRFFFNTFCSILTDISKSFLLQTLVNFKRHFRRSSLTLQLTLSSFSSELYPKQTYPFITQISTWFPEEILHFLLLF